MSEITYRLHITKQTPNPEFVPGRQDYPMVGLPPVLDLSALEVLITEAQFEAIRKAVLERF